MALTAEEKLMAALLLSLIAALTFGLYSLHLIDAGKAEEKAAVFEVEQKAEQKAQATETLWQAKLTSAQTARQGEIDAANDAALKPVSLSVPKYTLRAILPAGAPAAGASTAPAAAGVVCSSVLQESPEQLRADFAAAKRADLLTADYRDLYNSWPVEQTKK
jgi:hypothetical protein